MFLTREARFDQIHDEVGQSWKEDSRSKRFVLYDVLCHDDVHFNPNIPSKLINSLTYNLLPQQENQTFTKWPKSFHYHPIQNLPNPKYPQDIQDNPPSWPIRSPACHLTVYLLSRECPTIHPMDILLKVMPE
jgi:hypothetical protein